MKAAGISALVPNQFSSGDGRVSVIGWILFGITVTALVYNIVQSHQNITQNKKKEEQDTNDIKALQAKTKELEHNLKSALGGNYQTL